MFCLSNMYILYVVCCMSKNANVQNTYALMHFLTYRKNELTFNSRTVFMLKASPISLKVCLVLSSALKHMYLLSHKYNSDKIHRHTHTCVCVHVCCNLCNTNYIKCTLTEIKIA